MTAFQIIVLSAGTALAAMLLAASARRWLNPREAIIVLIVLAAVLIAVAWPNLTTRLAQLVGIRRGADLIAYLTTVTMIVGFFMLYSRLRQLRRQLTLVVREIALLHATTNPTPTAEPPRTSNSSD